MLADYHYSYDGNGNRIRKDSLTGSTTYAYDSLNRLAKVQYPKGLEEFTYDKADNRIRRLTEKEEELYQYDVCNRLVSKESRALGESAPMSQNPKEKIKTHASLSTDKRKISTFRYDNQGNLLREERKTEGSRQESIYSYDGFNRQKKIVNFENKTQINRYDGEGLRHEMEENGRLVKFLYHDREAVAEEKEDGKYIRYIRGYDLVASDSECARTYYHYASDEQGSITHVLGEDENGEYDLRNYYEYGAFGDFREKYEEVENRFGYNGEIFDSIGGQYYLRARYYNPVIGRFTQEDTYYGDGLNLYAYCRNLPVGYEDPSGYVCKRKYESYKALREMGLSPKEAKKMMDEIKMNNPKLASSALKGEFVEKYMHEVMNKTGYKVLPSKVGSNNGYDGLYVKKDANGKLQVAIGEGKYGGSRLGITNMGPQMSKGWIKGNLKKMFKSKNPKVVKAAKVIQNNIKTGNYDAYIFKITKAGNIKYTKVK